MWAAGEERYVPERSPADQFEKELHYAKEDRAPEEQAALDAKERWEGSLRAQCGAVRQQLPLLWEALDVQTLPLAHAPDLMPPSIALTGGEMLIYRAGQRSVFEWMRRCADLSAHVEETSDASDAE